jgi:hypothetical protein
MQTARLVGKEHCDICKSRAILVLSPLQLPETTVAYTIGKCDADPQYMRPPVTCKPYATYYSNYSVPCYILATS